MIYAQLITRICLAKMYGESSKDNFKFGLPKLIYRFTHMWKAIRNAGSPQRIQSENKIINVLIIFFFKLGT